MLRRILLGLLLASAFGPAECLAKIDIDWSRATIPFSAERRQAVEARIHEIAGVFNQDEYADLGKLDFRTHERTVLVQVRDFGVNRERGLQLSGAVFLNQARLGNDNELRLILMHEFAHLYDFVALADMSIDYLLSSESGSGRVAEKRLDESMRAMKKIKFMAEKRAHDKMLRYARRQGLKVPGDIE